MKDNFWPDSGPSIDSLLTRASIPVAIHVYRYIPSMIYMWIHLGYSHGNNSVKVMGCSSSPRCINLFHSFPRISVRVYLSLCVHEWCINGHDGWVPSVEGTGAITLQDIHPAHQPNSPDLHGGGRWGDVRFSPESLH